MKISISKENLLEGLSKVGKAITGKSTLKALTGVYIESVGDKLVFRGMDTDISIETTVKAEVLLEGSLLVDYKLLTEVVRRLPNDLISIDSEERQEVIIDCQKSQFSLLTMDADEYPKFPKLDDEDSASIKIKQSVLKELINKVSFAAALDDTRPILKGILFQLQMNKVNLVALDGYRLAIASENTNCDKELEVVIDTKHFVEVSKLLDQTGDVEMIFTQNHLLFKTTETIILCRLLEGQYINYKSLVRDQSKFKFDVNRMELLNAIERVALVGKSNNLIKMQVNGDGESMKVTSRSTVGNALEEVAVTGIEGLIGEFIIAFNSKYVIDVLKNNDNEMITLFLDSNVLPCIMRGKGVSADMETYLVLPIRLS